MSDREKRNVTIVNSCFSICNECICISSILGFSQFELVSVCKLPNILSFAFPSWEQFASTHEDYLQVLAEKAEFIAGILVV